MFTLSGWTLSSRVLGLYRDRLLAVSFGGSVLLDAFILAFQIPNLFRRLFGEGALASAFVPRYLRARAQDPAGGEAFAGLVLTRLALLLGALAGAGMILAGVLAAIAAPRTAVVAVLALPQLPYLVFICFAGICAGALQVRSHFWVPAAAPVVLNLVLITAVLIWRDVMVLPYAVLLTGVLQAGAHLVALARTGGVPPLATASTPALRDLRSALAPTLLSAGMHQLNTLLDSVIAYALVTRLEPTAVGAVSVLYFANRLLQFPLALVGHATGTAIYPELSRAAVEGYAATGAVLRRGTGILAFWLIPASVGLLVVAEPLVRALFQAGSYDVALADRTVLATRIFAAGVLPLALNMLLLRVFLAHLDQRWPLRIALAAVGLNLVLNLVLVHTPLRESGLVLASVITGVLASLASIRELARRGTGQLFDPGAALVPLLAAAALGLAVHLLLWWWRVPASAGTGMHALRLAAAVALGGVVYAALAGPWARRRLKRGAAG